MEGRRDGKNSQHDYSSTHLEDEQASSDEEGFPLEQNGHPSANAHNSMYSRIQEEVQSKLPSIDFSPMEVDGEGDDVATGRYWPSGHVNGVLNIHGIIERKDIDGNGDPPLGLSEPKFSEANSDRNNKGCSMESDETINQCISSNTAPQNCMSEGCAEIRESMLCRSFSHDVIDNAESVGDQKVDPRKTLDTGENDLLGKMVVVDGNANSFEGFGAGKMRLEANIDEKNLDLALGLDAMLLDSTNHSKILDHISSDVSTNNEDTDAPLLDRLSSFAISEKKSVCESNLLLEQILTTHDATGDSNSASGLIINDEVKSSQVSNIGKERSLADEHKTIFIDLRNPGLSSSLTNYEKKSTSTKEESSSGSEGEDWMSIRKDIKAGLNVKPFRKPEGCRKNKLFENKVHDRMTKRTYERLRNHEITKDVTYDHLSERYSKSLHTNKNYEGIRNIDSTAVFDVGPLEEKIRSWHQISNRSEAFGLLNDVHFGERNMICRTDETNDVYSEAKDCANEHSVDAALGVREAGCSLEDCEVERGNVGKLNVENEEPVGSEKMLLKDSSLLGLEDGDFKSGVFRNARRSLLIVDENDQSDSENCSKPVVHCTDVGLPMEVIGENNKRDNGSYCVEELAAKVRISDNLMLIKANISADLQHIQSGPEASSALSSCGEKVAGEKLEASGIETDDLTGACRSLRDGGNRSAHGNNEPSEEPYGGMFSLEEIEKGLLTGGITKSDNQAGDIESETELKTFSIAESSKSSSVSNGEEMVELSSTLKGLLPQYGREMFPSYLNSKRKAMHGGRENENTGEETPMIARQSCYVASSPSSNGGHDRIQDTEAIKKERQLSVKKTVNMKVENYDATGWDRTTENDENGNDRIGQNKSKRKSKKKNRRSAECVDEKEVNEGKNSGDRGQTSKSGLDVKIARDVGNIDKELKKKPVCLVRESERIQIEEKVKLLKERLGAANVVFDEKLSYTHALKSLPSSLKDEAKLLLKIRLQSPGVCSKSCAKNSLSFNERSDAYIGLCTLFLSLLQGSKFKLCDTLSIPFDVIAMKQASIDSELQLLVGIIEHEVQVEATQQLKRGKPSKAKRNFYQAVTQYLNKTDLETVLSDIMKVDYTERDGLTVLCPGSRKLSSYVTVSQDETAVARIFNLKPSLVWNRSDEIDRQLCDDICWMEGKQKKNETTCVMVKNLTSMLPRTIAAFMRTARNNSIDICGLRIAYISRTDKSEEPTFVTAIRGPNVTTVDGGTSFTADTQELKSVKSNYMPCNLESHCDDLRDVTVSSSNSAKPFSVRIAEPLITYIIGRGHGEREVVNWFGRRTLCVADAELISDDAKEITSKSSSLPEKLDVLSRHAACASLLTISPNRIVLTMSHFVPTIFISIAIADGESRGLHALSAGKILLKEEDMLLMGLKMESEEERIGSKSKIGKLNQSVSVIIFEGENPLYRAYGFVRYLFTKMNGLLPRDALTKDVVRQTLKESSGYEIVKQDHSIEEFFAVVLLDKKVIKVLERMTSHNLSHQDNEVMNALPSNWKLFLLPEAPPICVSVFVGEPMVKIFPYILQTVLGECLDDPFCINAKASTERKYLHQERPVAEIIGLKYYASLSKDIAHVCCPYVVGAKHWASSVESLRNGPVIVLVVRLLDTITNMEEKCRKICRHVSKLLRSKELNCNIDCNYDAFSYTHLDTVLRVLLSMFKFDELMPDACPTWFKSTQWPVYLSRESAIVKRINPVLGLFANTCQLQPFRFGMEASNPSLSEIKILSPLDMSVTAELILGKQVSFSCMVITVDYNFSKFIPKILGMLRRDLFDVVGLNFPSGLSPSFVNYPTMHVVLRRPDAVFRLNQWLPGLRNELHNNHTIQVSLGAQEAFDAITRNFQKTQSGGIFDYSNLSIAEKLTFKNDDIYDTRMYRRVKWTNHSNANLSSSTDSRHHTKPESSRGFVMPEVNVVIITNVMMRGTYLDDYIPERAKFLGFWEHISSLGYKTIGARMTSLSQEQVHTLLEKLKLSAMDHRIMEKRMPASNGPIFALVLLRDFALSNFWNTVTKKLKEEECKIISENVLIPTNKNQVEILASSLFETVAPNSEMEIEKITTLKECHVVT